MVASTWPGDHQGRSSAPLIRCVKPSEYGALTLTLELELDQRVVITTDHRVVHG